MRLGFWCGCIVGVAATAYMMRDKDLSWQENMDRWLDTASKWVGSAARGTRTVELAGNQAGGKERTNRADSTHSGADKVKEWIRHEPEVRHQVEQILKDEH